MVCGVTPACITIGTFHEKTVKMISVGAVVSWFADAASINTKASLWASFAIKVYVTITFTSFIGTFSRLIVRTLEVLQAVKLITTWTVTPGLANTFLLYTKPQGSVWTVLTLWVLGAVAFTCVISTASDRFIVWTGYIWLSTGEFFIAVILWKAFTSMGRVMGIGDTAEFYSTYMFAVIWNSWLQYVMRIPGHSVSLERDNSIV